mmetsp:Transcript_37208/g.86800  ORF Transcript_37208/g.86800 Transcript_37208/m.86800 type:complete len:501 (-) Transcript_37208:220-1722(-)|eukprot:CAMPEP_0113301122 /NCGR_PEP_ID=MMETSP0010_2-20120614/2483_1 /TAXON_ID=216773 ORGANISM="Corethron hystrix, Strain 308" /NCGR_SAMPLE_ID=MMETSP0010_2 /ASSEMBLY_ACC=CAM_ASM_000155 /LENGTH=500 /DNA_ID=CAMNT_0000154693 /DNA_START=541 /DNA_END=2043 /DNA_ORIENTATION=+ /assembly_acc=CAM_ASM_000155
MACNPRGDEVSCIGNNNEGFIDTSSIMIKNNTETWSDTANFQKAFLEYLNNHHNKEGNTRRPHTRAEADISVNISEKDSILPEDCTWDSQVFHQKMLMNQKTKEVEVTGDKIYGMEVSALTVDKAWRNKKTKKMVLFIPFHHNATMPGHDIDYSLNKLQMRWNNTVQQLTVLSVTKASHEINLYCESENPIPVLSKLFGYFLIENCSRNIPFEASFFSTESDFFLPLDTIRSIHDVGSDKWLEELPFRGNADVGKFETKLASSDSKNIHINIQKCSNGDLHINSWWNKTFTIASRILVLLLALSFYITPHEQLHLPRPRLFLDSFSQFFRFQGTKADSPNSFLTNGVYSIFFSNEHDDWNKKWLGKLSSYKNDFKPRFFGKDDLDANQVDNRLLFKIQSWNVGNVKLYTINIQNYNAGEYHLGTYDHPDGTYSFHVEKARSDQDLFFWLISKSNDESKYKIIPFDHYYSAKKMTVFNPTTYRDYDPKAIAWEMVSMEDLK